MITALGGGVGASKLLIGLRAALGTEHLTTVVNTGDDITLHGLRICPDIDTVIYWLSGVVSRRQGWGQEGDTMRTSTALTRFGAETWLRLGDLDLATHIFRTQLRGEGLGAGEITSRLVDSFNIEHTTVLPMTESDVETWVETAVGWMHFQEYFVRDRMKPRVLGVELRGAGDAEPSPGLLEALEGARGIVICPSNPIISVGTILQIPGIRQALVHSSARVAAVSPIVGGAALKGPAARLMRALGHEVSALGVARLYKDFLDVIIIDSVDRGLAPAIEDEGMGVVVADTIMSDDSRSEALARVVLEALG